MPCAASVVRCGATRAQIGVSLPSRRVDAIRVAVRPVRAKAVPTGANVENGTIDLVVSTEEARRTLQFDKVILDATILTHEEYLEAVDLLTAQRNARADRSGFSPDQRSLGKNVRLLGHLLSDGHIDADLLGAQASDSIRRSWDIPDAAARASVTRRNTEACKAALAARR